MLTQHAPKAADFSGPVKETTPHASLPRARAGGECSPDWAAERHVVHLPSGQRLNTPWDVLHRKTPVSAAPSATQGARHVRSVNSGLQSGNSERWICLRMETCKAHLGLLSYSLHAGKMGDLEDIVDLKLTFNLSCVARD